MQKLQDSLKQYKAKLDGTTLYNHNEDLIDILEQLNIPDEVKEQMNKIIWFHDIGKVVDSFQNNIENTHRKVRHEMLSASIKGLTEEEMLVILTHHKSLKDILERFKVYGDEYLSELKELQDKLNIEVVDIRQKLKKYYKKQGRSILKEKKLIYLKGLLNYCDHIGSSSIKTIENGTDMNRIFKFEEYSSVQEEAKLVDDDIIIISPTGSGKTEASLYWASNIDKTNKNRIFYILPYCASITAMYNRLKKKDLSVGMLHSKALYFLYKDNEDYEGAKEQYQAFKYFTKHITIATTHQIFKALFNCKFNEMMLSIFKHSTFIIDEIHCYNEKEVALILTSLKYLKEYYNIRICIMSASIPTKLLDLIKEELDINKVLRLTEQELIRIKRHRVEYRSKLIEEDIEVIKQAIKEGKRVIVCVNTVQQSVYLYKLLKPIVKENEITLINSYFNQRDRERIEKELNDVRVLVGTQAIEVSLDIDFDELYTEVSPIDSQIQRWGRVNRKRVKDLIERKNIFVYDTESSIYDESIIIRTKKLLRELEYIEEKDIQKYLDTVYVEDFEDYKKYKHIMDSEILTNISMGIWDNDYNEYNKFTGVSVLPMDLEMEYKQFLNDNKYYDANSLLVNIPIWQFERSKEDNAIVLEEFVKGHQEYVILYKYNSKEGLQIGEKESKFF